MILYHKIMKWRFLFLSLILMACTPSNVLDCQYQAQGVIKSLTLELSHIHSKEDLIEKMPLLKKKMDYLVELMIQIKKLQDEKGEEITYPDPVIGEALMEEMKRIYYIEGARKLIEEIQRKPLLKLDAFVNSHNGLN